MRSRFEQKFTYSFHGDIPVSTVIFKNGDIRSWKYSARSFEQIGHHHGKLARLSRGVKVKHSPSFHATLHQPKQPAATDLQEIVAVLVVCRGTCISVVKTGIERGLGGGRVIARLCNLTVLNSNGGGSGGGGGGGVTKSLAV